MSKRSARSAKAVDQFLPKWTERVSSDGSGRDPLGLSRVSFIIADYLLFRIASTTDRARYFSFFCWALWPICREQAPERVGDLRRHLRRREAVLALATLANDPKSSPVGVTAPKIEWKKGLQEERFIPH